MITIDPFHYLVPKFRRTGNYLMLAWREHNEGQHIILAKSMRGITDAFIAAFKKYGKGSYGNFGDFGIQDYRQIEIVLPPQDLIDEYAKAKLNNELNNFGNYVVGLVGYYAKLYGVVPHPFRELTQTELENVDYGKTYLDRTFGIFDHSNRCFAIDRDDVPKLFEKAQHQYRDKKPIQQAFTGQSYDPNKPLYMVVGDFGHHSRGADIVKAASDRDNHLFFFHGEKLKHPPELLAIIGNAKKQLAIKTKQQKEEREIRNIQRNKETADELKKLLGL